jgi:hypothetical protein
MTAISAKQVHREMIALLSPILEGEGFRRVRPASTAIWSRPVEDEFVVLRVQISRSGDAFGWYGTSFTIELELSEIAKPGTGRVRWRLPALLSDREREEIRRKQNALIAGLPAAPVAALAQLPESARTWYLAHGELRVEPYAEDEDVWFRYSDARDLEGWFPILTKLVPSAVGEAIRRIELAAPA